MLTRRQGIMAAIAGVIGIMSGRAKTEQLVSGTSNITLNPNAPQSVSFSLDTFAKFTFRLGDEEVTVTGKEVFDALKHDPLEDRVIDLEHPAYTRNK